MQNHYPAVDVLGSISRVMDDIVDEKHRQNAYGLKQIMATYRKAEDLINIGAYVEGTNPKIDYAITMIDRINAYLRQDIGETVAFEDSVAQMDLLFENRTDEPERL
jgi:flagellum-specific ATP synthase